MHLQFVGSSPNSFDPSRSIYAPYKYAYYANAATQNNLSRFIYQRHSIQTDHRQAKFVFDWSLSIIINIWIDLNVITCFTLRTIPLLIPNLHKNSMIRLRGNQTKESNLFQSLKINVDADRKEFAKKVVWFLFLEPFSYSLYSFQNEILSFWIRIIKE